MLPPHGVLQQKKAAWREPSNCQTVSQRTKRNIPKHVQSLERWGWWRDWVFPVPRLVRSLPWPFFFPERNLGSSMGFWLTGTENPDPLIPPNACPTQIPVETAKEYPNDWFYPWPDYHHKLICNMSQIWLWGIVKECQRSCLQILLRYGQESVWATKRLTRCSDKLTLVVTLSRHLMLQSLQC